MCGRCNPCGNIGGKLVVTNNIDLRHLTSEEYPLQVVWVLGLSDTELLKPVASEAQVEGGRC